MQRLTDANALKTDVKRNLPEGTDDFGDIPVGVAERSFLGMIDRQLTIEAYTEADVISAYNEGVAYGLEIGVRHGRWIFENSLAGINAYRCSECNRLEVAKDLDNIYETCPYCNCGAKMDGGADNG